MNGGGAKSVVIVGGGIIGLCCAWYALKAGHRVTIVERNGPDHDGCSLGNAGMIVPSHFVPLAAPGMIAMGLRMLPDPQSPFALRPRLSRDLLDWGMKFRRASTEDRVARAAPVLRDLHLTSRALYEELAEELDNDFLLEKRGLLLLCRTAAALHEETKLAARATALGVPAEVVTPEEAGRLDPGITMNIAGGVFFPLDCHLAPHRLMAGLTRALEAAGARFCWHSEVTGWQTDSSGRIAAARTGKGETLEADAFVLAGGAWSPETARPLGLSLPMQAGKGYSLTLEKPREMPRICAILTEARVAVTPMGGALRFGGTMELTGLDLSINRARVRGIVKAIPRYYPAFGESDFDGVTVWSGLRPCSPDGLPYLGVSRRWENLVIATGHAMMGVSLGPVTGRIVAQMLSLNAAPPAGIELLSPDRFARR